MNPRIDHQYWMRIAVEVAKASTCRANVGCILVHHNMIVGMGYVGSVHGDYHCEDPMPHSRDEHVLVETDKKGSTKTGTTCIRTIHAEVNAILKCQVRGSTEGGWLKCYSTYQPCLDCTKLLLQVGVRDIYYLNPYRDEDREQYINRLAVAIKSNMFIMQVGLTP